MNSEPIRILLSRPASDALSATGETALVVTGKATWPDDPSRWVIYLVPTSVDTANAAIGLVQGTHRAVRIRAKASSGDQLPEEELERRHGKPRAKSGQFSNPS